MRINEAYTDHELVEMLNKGKESAFDELYFRYVPRIDAFAKIYIKDKDLREEVLQEVFIKIWEKRDTINKDLSFKAFLFQVVKNNIYNIFRKKVYEVSLDLSEMNDYSHNNIEDQLNFSELQEKATEIIECLPDVQKQIFKLSRIEGMKNEEIAQKLSLSKRTVEHHIYLALKTIRKKLTISGVGSTLLFLWWL
jgi:RNA polymerase sigma-70 factor, ECF subfamily